MTTIQSDERVVLDVDMDADIPCDLAESHEHNGTPIGPARWRVFWRTDRICGCGGMRSTSLICTPHKDSLLEVTHVSCLDCLTVWAIGWVLIRIEPL